MNTSDFDEEEEEDDDSDDAAKEEEDEGEGGDEISNDDDGKDKVKADEFLVSNTDDIYDASVTVISSQL